MRKKLLLLFILMPVFGTFPLSAQTIDTALIKVYYDSTILLIKSGNYDRAVQTGKEALRLHKKNNEGIDTTNMRIYNKIGSALSRDSKYGSSMIYLKKSLAIIEQLKLDSSLLSTESYELIGDVFFNQGDNEKALDFYEKSLKIKLLQLNEEHQKIVGTYHRLANIYSKKTNYKKALEYYDQALKITLKNKGEIHSSTASCYESTGHVYLELGQYQKAKEHIQKSLDIKIQVFGDMHPITAIAYNNMGGLFSAQRKDKMANDYYEKAINIFLKTIGNDHPKIAGSYNNLGLINIRIGSYEKAIMYFEKALSIYLQVYNENYWVVGGVYHNLGLVYGMNKDYPKATFYFEKALSIYLRDNNKDQQISRVYSNLGSLDRRQNNHKAAIANYKKALNRHLKIHDEIHPRAASIYFHLGSSYKALGVYEKAIAYTEKSLNTRKEVLGENHPYTAEGYTQLGSIYILQEKYQAAKLALETAINIIGYDLNNPDDFSKVSDLFALDNILMEKINLCNSMDKQSSGIYDKSIFHLYDLREMLQDYIYWTNPDQVFKPHYLESSFKFHEDALNLYLLKNKKEDIFEIMEKSKSRELLIQFQQSNVQNFIGMTDSLVEKEYNLNTDIVFYEKKKFQAEYESKESSDSLINSYKDILFGLNKERDDFIKNLEKQYPDYHQLKYNQQVVDVQQIQNTLKPDQALVEYFVGDSSIFIFVVRKEQIEVKKMVKDFSLEGLVKDLRKGVFEHWINPDQSKNGFKESQERYTSAAYQLYEKLIQPVSSFLPSKLIIVPDGLLNFIPFDILLTEHAQTTDYGKLEYIVKKYQISYNYSGTLYNHLSGRSASVARNNVLSVAPYFEGISSSIPSIVALREGHGRLPFNEKEAKTIADLLNGKALIGDQATKQGFIDYAKDYKILHLATHSKSNDAMGDFSYIAFQANKDSSEQNDRLYAQELYNLNLDADMVVLSACESGLGQLKRGEGIIGLARAFAYAGAQSTITSLWSVSDLETTELMKLFYANLQEGMEKDEALRHAKLNYINTAERKAPFFWAGFVPSGNMQAIALNNGKQKLYLSIVSSIVFFLLIFGFYRYWRLPKQA